MSIAILLETSYTRAHTRLRAIAVGGSGPDIVGQVGAGHTIEELLAGYPYLEREDILQALRYAAWLPEECEVTLPRA